MAEQKRVEWIDVARGLGLLFVVIGHTMTTPIRNASNIAYMIYSLIYFFHMPFMFYLSGRTFGMLRERNMKLSASVWFRKKWNSLMVPYLVYGTIVYLIFFVANCQTKLHGILEDAGYGTQSVKDWIYGMLIGDNLYAYHLWFIYALFLMNIVVYFLLKTGKCAKYILFTMAFLCIAARVYIDTTYWGIANLFMKCFLWFVVGMYFDYSKYSKKIWYYVWMLFGVAYAFLVNTGVCQEIYKLPPIVLEMEKWIADVGIMFLLVWISMLCGGKIKAFFDYTGRNSYGIYLFHQPFFASGGGLVLYKVLGLPLWIAIVLTFALCYAFPILFMKVLDCKAFCWLKPYLLGTKK